MEDYLKYRTYRIKETITEEKVSELNIQSKPLIGIEKFKCAGQIISFIYNPYEISEDEIIKWLYAMKLTVKKHNPKSFKNKLKRIAKDNKISFGNKRLDCCGLND